MSRFVQYILFLGFISAIIACEDSSSIGSDLLNDEKFSVQYSDDVDIKSLTVGSKRVQTFNSSLSTIFSVGEINDPVFGRKSADLYFDVGFNSIISIPSFEGGTLDSMVLVLAYDSLSFYGENDIVHDVEIYLLDEDLDDLDSAYIDQPIMHSTVVGSKSFNPSFSDSITIVNYLDTSDVRLSPQLRIPIDNAWANQLFGDTSLYSSDDALKTFFKGFYLKSKPSGNGFFGINMSSTQNGENGLNRLLVYYRNNEGEKRVYSFRMFGKRGQYIDKDYQSSLANQSVSDSLLGDSLILIESYNGLIGKLEFGDLSFFEDKIINHAKLVFHTYNDPSELGDFKPATQIVLSEIDDQGTLIDIADIEDLADRNIPFSAGFGGSRILENGAYRYEMFVTKWLKEVLSDTTKDRSLFIDSFLKRQFPNRTILYGAGNSTKPVRLEVTYTNR